MIECAFTIPGEPQGKARPKFGMGRTYTPAKTVEYEKLVCAKYAAECARTFFGMSAETGEKQPVSIIARAYYGVPKSFSKKKRALALANAFRPTKKPDADNIAKIICDALNGVAWLDDAQVVSLTVDKFWGEPRVEVEISEVDA